ncbi:CopD family protein [Immundisolibacter sp.]|uniref:CopD family protein n=1 Tax=Immundisolibacter sp. TaxID=1934948 RepID=UPI00260F0B97|nr:CopD family protein [Immundisolibacter sp.]MDD3650009.1 CopD family protein [Immundisolibacter sp.]
MYGLILFLHILGATVWTGGHIVLSVVVLPGVLRGRAPDQLLRFEAAFEKIGMPALLVQVVTGIVLARRLIPDVADWFDFSNPVAHVVVTKLTLLAVTVALALDARFRVLPKLDASRLTDMAWHIVPVTVLSVLFVAAGVSFRAGWF